MKILFILEYYYPHVGGGEIFFRNLAERLVKKGHKCGVVTSRIKGTSCYEKINGVEVFRIDTPSFWSRYWFTFISIPYVLKLGRRYDIFHTMTYNGVLSTYIASKLLRKPAIITIFEVLLSLWKHISNFNYINARLHMLLERVSIKLSFNKYICFSYYTFNYVRLLGINDKKMEVIYPGVDQNLFSYNIKGREEIRKELGLEEKFVYLYFGRPGVFKGVDFLLKAVPLISKKIPNSKLLLILSKEPTYRYKEVKSLIDKLSIENSLILLEEKEHDVIPKYISGADCVVIPSLTEGFGFTCAESCSIGVPVVATYVGSIPEIIFGRYELVKPRDPEEIYKGIEKIYYGHSKISYKKEYKWDTCILKYEEVYYNLIEKKIDE